jgi:uncharacterized protein YfcZ (UPF0381/DUF406 family)
LQIQNGCCKVKQSCHEAAEGAHAEPTDVKSKIKEFINHHLLDAHDFTVSANEETGAHYGFQLFFGIMVCKYFHLQNFTGEELQNTMEISTFYTTKKYTKQMLLEL